MEQVYRELETGEIVKGIGLPAFIHNAGYSCVLIKVYEDGIIDCWDMVDFDGFVEKVRSGWVVTQLPKDGEINRLHSFYGKTSELSTYVEEGEFIKEVKDTLDALQGRPTSSQRCFAAFEEYLLNPTRNTDVLRKEYDSIPDHLKRYVLGDMDLRDRPIRQVISGEFINDETIKCWKEWYIGYMTKE